MPLTPAQDKQLYENLMSWGELHEDTQKRIASRVKGEILNMLQEVEPIHLPTEYVGVAMKAWEEAEKNFTPWFFLEILLEKEFDNGETVEQYIDNQVAEYCKNSVYYPADNLTFGLEPI